MNDHLDTVLIEFCCRREERDVLPHPDDDLEQRLAQQERLFAVEEFIADKAVLADEPDWVERFAAHPTETEAHVAVFLVERADKPYFDTIVNACLAGRRRDAEQAPRGGA